jgi:peptide/nickel transport system ATP-binding protein
MSPIVTLDDVHTDIALRNGTAHPVSGVSLTVGKGESLGIVGESGCGKTMTALSIIRLLPPGGAARSRLAIPTSPRSTKPVCASFVATGSA